MTRVAIIGAGNVATALAAAIDRLPDMQVSEVFSRDIANARRLTAKLADATPTDSLENISAGSDVYIIAVSDDAIAATAATLAGRAPEALWLHTSGSTGIGALAPLGLKTGVLYPLMTFSRDKGPDFGLAPVFVEGNNPEAESEAEQFARRLTGRVHHADSRLRAELHLAAVMACNFANHLWDLADRRLRDNGLDLGVMSALLRETLDKALEIGPHEGQTGPARRGDREIIAAQGAALPSDEAAIYNMLSRSIMKMYHK